MYNFCYTIEFTLSPPFSGKIGWMSKLQTKSPPPIFFNGKYFELQIAFSMIYQNPLLQQIFTKKKSDTLRPFTFLPPFGVKSKLAL